MTDDVAIKSSWVSRQYATHTTRILKSYDNVPLIPQVQQQCNGTNLVNECQHVNDFTGWQLLFVCTACYGQDEHQQTRTSHAQHGCNKENKSAKRGKWDCFAMASSGLVRAGAPLHAGRAQDVRSAAWSTITPLATNAVKVPPLLHVSQSLAIRSITFRCKTTIGSRTGIYSGTMTREFLS